VKLAIIGSRGFNDYNYMLKTIHDWMVAGEGSYFWLSRITEIVSGGARGADSLAELYADDHGISKKIFPAEWEKHSKSAGFKRNQLIIDHADMVLAFWDGKSKGTEHSINLAYKARKPVFIYTDWKDSCNATKI
jgi:hypothetical protein